MDEAEKATFEETVDFYEQQKQEQFHKIENMQKEIRALRGKVRGYKRTIRKLKDENEQLKPNKQQHYRNQTGGKKGVRR